MSAIERIGNALQYDAVETLIMRDFGAALAMAVLQAESLPIGEESAPESLRTVPVSK